MIPAACTLGGNQLKTEHQRMRVLTAESEFARLREEHFRLVEAIRVAESECAAARGELGTVAARRAAATGELAGRLQTLRVLEEDLANARKRAAEVQADIAAIRALEQRVAAKETGHKELGKRIDELDGALGAARAAVGTRQKELDGLLARLKALEELRARLVEELAAAAAAAAPEKKEPPKKE